MSIQFDNPPLVEALCEFHFEQSQPWDWTIPGLMYARVKDEFPIREQQQGIQMVVGQGLPAPPQVENIQRVHFVRPDRSSLVQVGAHFLAVNHLRPYAAWPSFRDIIWRNFDVFTDISQAKSILRVGLRYINKIEVPLPPDGATVRIKDYLLTFPGIPESVHSKGPIRQYLQRLEIGNAESQGMLVLQSGTIPPENEGHQALLLDLDFVTDLPAPIPLDAARAWVERAHKEIEAAFLACITPKSRELFEERCLEQPTY